MYDRFELPYQSGASPVLGEGGWGGDLVALLPSSKKGSTAEQRPLEPGGPGACSRTLPEDTWGAKEGVRGVQ